MMLNKSYTPHFQIFKTVHNKLSSFFFSSSGQVGRFTAKPDQFHVPVHLQLRDGVSRKRIRLLHLWNVPRREGRCAVAGWVRTDAHHVHGTPT